MALRKLHVALGEGLPSFVDGFYRHLLSFAEMRALLPDEAALERLKRLQVAYFHRLTEGNYDLQYGKDRERIGLAHARIGLTPGWYLGAYSHYLTELLPSVAELLQQRPDDHRAALQALIKVVFLDMGIAIDAYIHLRDNMIVGLRNYSAAFARLLGCSVDALTAQPLGSWLELNDLASVVACAQHQSHAQADIALRLLAEPLPIPVAVAAHVLPASGEQPQARILLTLRDLREREQLMRDLLNAQEVANIGTWHTYFDGLIHLTKQASDIVQSGTRPLRPHKTWLRKLHPQDRAAVLQHWRQALKTGVLAFTARMQCVGQDAIRWIDVRGKVEHDSQGNPMRGYGTVLDMTERMQVEEKMRYLAQYDPLTGLPNRKHGMEQAQQLLERSLDAGRQAVVLFVDLDRFKEINDTQGHAVGDQVLVAVARRCLRQLRPGDVLARLGGDEFMLARQLEDYEPTLELGWKLLHALEQPLTLETVLGTRSFVVGASVGVARLPEHGQDVHALLKHADIAMYRAKTSDCGCQLYDAAMGAQLQRRLEMAERLKTALAQQQLELHYQPKVGLADGRLRGVEALSRWHDPQWGWVSPGEFIAVAEERGLIAELGDWSLRTAARQWRAWQQAGIANPPVIAVNVSAVDISMDEGFADRVRATVLEAGAHPGAIELEVTETALMRHPQQAANTAARLVEMGFSLVIDDFGTGYSSLARLHALPLSGLKIDMAFVRTMLTDTGSYAIVSAIISMARALGLRTVAEGVETEAQRDALRTLRCNEVQGYFYSKPLPADALAQQWLTTEFSELSV